MDVSICLKVEESLVGLITIIMAGGLRDTCGQGEEDHGQLRQQLIVYLRGKCSKAILSHN